MEFIIKLAILLSVIFIVVNLVQYFMSFHPVKEYPINPAAYLFKTKEYVLEGEDGSHVNGLYSYAPTANGKTMLYLHGNAGNLADRTYHILFFNNMGFDVFIIDYRGYGKSPGIPTENGVFHDAHTAYQWLLEVKHLNPNDIIVYGRSLGGAIAIDLSVTAQIEQGLLILESTFPSTKYLAAEMMHQMPFYKFLLNTFDSASKAPNIKTPVLYIHGDNDNTIDIEAGRELYTYLPEPKAFIEIKGGDHTNCFEVEPEKYAYSVRNFVKIKQLK